jgi:hypothetical protein
MFITESGVPQWQKRYENKGHSIMMPVTERLISLLIALSGVLIMFISTLAIIDLVCCQGSLDFGTWGSGARMAIPTAVCLILVGSALILTSGVLKSVVSQRK